MEASTNIFNRVMILIYFKNQSIHLIFFISFYISLTITSHIVSFYHFSFTSLYLSLIINIPKSIYPSLFYSIFWCGNVIFLHTKLGGAKTLHPICMNLMEWEREWHLCMKRRGDQLESNAVIGGPTICGFWQSYDEWLFFILW